MQIMVFDTETTGLIGNRTIKLEHQPSIIEFYGCLVDLENGSILGEPLNLMIRPPRPLSDKPAFGEKKTTTQITGITNEMLSGEKLFPHYAQTIEEFISKAPLIASHNLSYDKEVLDIEYERLGRKIAWPRGICTVEQTVHLKGIRLSQAALYEHLFSEKFVDAHRAEKDTQALVRCLVELYKRGEI